MSEKQQESDSPGDTSPELEFATKEKQEARAFLRERFLRAIARLNGKKTQFHLYENTNVSAEFVGCDVECLEVYVRNLETPLGIIPDAVLRTNDIIYFTVDDVNTPS